jgi:GntR family transcriptional regulator
MTTRPGCRSASGRSEARHAPEHRTRRSRGHPPSGQGQHRPRLPADQEPDRGGDRRRELPAGSGLPATRQLAVDLGVNFHTVNKAYDLLRREGLLRIGRKAGAVVQPDAAGGPPRPGWEQGWAGRLRTLLAEAAAQGLPADGIVWHCQAAVARFAFPGRPGPPARRAPGHDTGGPDGLSRRPAVQGADDAGPSITGRPVQRSGVEAAGVEVPCDGAVAFGSPVMACPWYGLPGRRW